MGDMEGTLSPEDAKLFAEHSGIVQEMQGIVKSILKLQEVSMDAHFVNDLKCDSLDQAEIVMEIESKYQITVDDKALERMRHVKDAIREALFLIKQKDTSAAQ